MQTFIVFGANGFVGTHVSNSLLESGCRVIASDISFKIPNRHLSINHQNIELVELDITDYPHVESVLKRCNPEILINCAAYGVDYLQKDSTLASKINIEAPVRMFELCSKSSVYKFIHIGSAYEYGNKPYPISEREPLDPMGIYGASKAAGSIFLFERAKHFNKGLIILRPFGMWGPGEGIHKFVPQLIASIKAGKMFKMSKGEQIRDYVYIKDMAKWIVRLALSDYRDTIQLLNLGSGNPVTIKDMACSIARELGGEQFVEIGSLPYRDNEIFSLVADNTLQRSLLGNLETTPYSVGVREMISEGAF